MITLRRIPFEKMTAANLVKKLHGYKNKITKGVIRCSVHIFCQVILATKCHNCLRFTSQCNVIYVLRKVLSSLHKFLQHSLLLKIPSKRTLYRIQRKPKQGIHLEYLVADRRTDRRTDGSILGRSTDTALCLSHPRRR